MSRLLRRALLALVIFAALLVLLAGGRQSAPNAARTVISARLESCSPDGRFYRSGHSGWIPTANCLQPPPVPETRR